MARNILSHKFEQSKQTDNKRSNQLINNPHNKHLCRCISELKWTIALINAASNHPIQSAANILSLMRSSLHWSPVPDVVGLSYQLTA